MSFLGKSHQLSKSQSIIHIENRQDQPPRTSVNERPLNILQHLFASKPKEIQHVRMETLFNVNQDIEHFHQDTFEKISPSFLYTTGSDIRPVKLFNRYNETQVSCIDNDKVLFDLVMPDSFKKIKLEKLRLMHIGLVIIGIKPMLRQGLGTKALVTLLDTRWTCNISKASLGMIEADLSGKGGLFDCTPDLLLNSKEFFKKFKVGIQTRGFLDLALGNKNLLLYTYYIGKLMQVKTPRYQLQLDDIVGLLANSSIKLLTPYKEDKTLTIGKEWNLSKFLDTQRQTNLIPSSGTHYIDSNGKETVRFTDFQEQLENSDSE